MKFKEQRGNVFVFDGGDTGGELELELIFHSGIECYRYENVLLDENLLVSLMDSSPYNDIQTAVNLMQILINEGLV